MRSIYKNKFELIEKYFSFELEEDELSEFDHLYKTYPEFQAAVHKYELAHNLVRKKYWSAGEQLVNEKRDHLERIAQLKVKRKISPLRLITIAASLLLFFGIFNWWIGTVKNNSDILSQSVLEVATLSTNLDPIRSTVRSGETAQSSQIWEAYNRKDWNAIINSTPIPENSNPIILLTAIAHYHVGNYNRSIKILQSYKLENNGMEDNILWWLAANNLQLKQYTSASANLEEIINKNYPTADKAAIILKRINALKAVD